MGVKRIILLFYLLLKFLLLSNCSINKTLVVSNKTCLMKYLRLIIIMGKGY